MVSDEEFLAQRRLADDRRFLIQSTDPETAPRLAPAMQAIKGLLYGAGSGWVRHSALLAGAVRASDLAVRTVDNMVRRATTAGMIEKRGEYSRAGRGRKASDTRAYRLADWPEAEVGEDV